jgi:ATP-dependent exoDNAse (exonuclease V) alpha subunit
MSKGVIMTGTKKGVEVLIPRIRITSQASRDLSVDLTRLQFPVRLAFAMTMNKAQGQSLSHVGIDLRDDVFSHGQLYVALSRATSGEQIKVLLPGGSPHPPLCKNVVYSEVFSNN